MGPIGGLAGSGWARMSVGLRWTSEAHLCFHSGSVPWFAWTSSQLSPGIDQTADPLYGDENLSPLHPIIRIHALQHSAVVSLAMRSHFTHAFHLPVTFLCSQLSCWQASSTIAKRKAGPCWTPTMWYQRARASTKNGTSGVRSI
eukprot:929037-Pelagomonas_calceolata.AAC.4